MLDRWTIVAPWPRRIRFWVWLRRFYSRKEPQTSLGHRDIHNRDTNNVRFFERCRILKHRLKVQRFFEKLVAPPPGPSWILVVSIVFTLRPFRESQKNHKSFAQDSRLVRCFYHDLSRIQSYPVLGCPETPYSARVWLPIMTGILI